MEEIEEIFEDLVIFSTIWSCGCILKQKDRQTFSQYFEQKIKEINIQQGYLKKLNDPQSNVYSFYFDIE